jgi:hypothetical protein
MSSSLLDRCGACVLPFLVFCATLAPDARGQEATLYAAARTPLRTVDETALPWLLRLEHGAALLRDDARVAHFAVIGHAFVVAGDPRSALVRAHRTRGSARRG